MSQKSAILGHRNAMLQKTSSRELCLQVDSFLAVPAIDQLEGSGSKPWLPSDDQVWPWPMPVASCILLDCAFKLKA